jgi:hypothetical protein
MSRLVIEGPLSEQNIMGGVKPEDMNGNPLTKVGCQNDQAMLKNEEVVTMGF